MPFYMAENMFCRSNPFYTYRSQPCRLRIPDHFLCPEVPFHIRKFIHSGKESFLRPFPDCHFFIIPKNLFYSSCFRLFLHREIHFPSFLMCFAQRFKRTGGAFRLSVRNTDDRSQLNQPLIKITRRIFRDDFFDQFFYF